MKKLLHAFKKDRLLWVCIIFCTVFYIVQNNNHRFKMHDFEVYYSAASKVIKHEGFYNQPYGLQSGIYKYSPAAAFLFIPFALLPFFAAATLYFFIISALIYLSIKKAFGLFERIGLSLNLKKENLLPQYNIQLISLLVLLTAFNRELHLGNVNLLLLFLCLLHIENFIDRKYMAAGVLLAVILLLKPHFLVFTPMLLFAGGVQTFISGFVFFAAAMALPVFYYGCAAYMALCKDWISTMVVHNSGDSLILAFNTVHHWLFKILPRTIPHGTMAVTFLTIAAVIVLLLILKKHGAFGKSNESFYAVSVVVLVALIPNITVTDTEHFLLALPLVVLLCVALNKRPFGIFYLLIIAAFVLYGFNWFELWGRKMSNFLNRAGVLGIGNAGIIALSLWYIKECGKKNTCPPLL